MFSKLPQVVWLVLTLLLYGCAQCEPRFGPAGLLRCLQPMAGLLLGGGLIYAYWQGRQ